MWRKTPQFVPGGSGESAAASTGIPRRHSVLEGSPQTAHVHISKQSLLLKEILQTPAVL